MYGFDLYIFTKFKVVWWIGKGFFLNTKKNSRVIDLGIKEEVRPIVGTNIYQELKEIFTMSKRKIIKEKYE
jgi:hypothetical protein